MRICYLLKETCFRLLIRFAYGKPLFAGAKQNAVVTQLLSRGYRNVTNKRIKNYTFFVATSTVM